MMQRIPDQIFDDRKDSYGVITQEAQANKSVDHSFWGGPRRNEETFEEVEGGKIAISKAMTCLE